MNIDGKKLAGEILARTKALSYSPKVVALVANETGATRSYLAIKAKYAAAAGCEFEIQRFPETVTSDELQHAVKKTDANALIVQLPLPSHIDPSEVCDAIPRTKDVDVLGSAARKKFESGDADALLPPVVAAVREILVRGKVNLKGKKGVVIGEGWLVGKPVATWLGQQGTEVTVVTKKSEDFEAVLSKADIIVCGAGHPHLIRPEMIKDGVVLIDAGTSESGGQMVGDADPACAPKCSLFTPVPGGVGPIAVACLFENAVKLATRQNS